MTNGNITFYCSFYTGNLDLYISNSIKKRCKYSSSLIILPLISTHQIRFTYCYDKFTKAFTYLREVPNAFNILPIPLFISIFVLYFSL